MTLRIFTGSSERHWEIAATQCDPEELEKSIQNQLHQPLAFLSGTFSEREEHWSAYEREAFAVVQAFRKLQYLVACKFLDLFSLTIATYSSLSTPSLWNHLLVAKKFFKLSAGS